MKENMLDVLVYLLENYMDKVYETEPNHDSIKQELVAAGFSSPDVSKAFSWLGNLVAMKNLTNNQQHIQTQSQRIYSRCELNKLDAECRGFILSLEQSHTINSSQRELVIERIMALETNIIDLEQVKLVAWMVVFNKTEAPPPNLWLANMSLAENPLTCLH